MQQIAGWLESLGMGEYAERFAENRIDMSVLAELTEQDLKDLGVVLGDRRKILRAIAQLDARAPAVLPRPLPPAHRDTAERRQLTVMFCDLVGSTALSARLDPEDMREIIGAYHGCCTALIGRHGGFVATYMGDGVLAYFGYPSAHEDDAERAVHAGLALASAAPGLVTAADAPLHVRIGIATGIVVVGDLLGVGDSQDRGIIGDTPNLAARLQGIAAPDTVVIADGTRRLLGNLFDLSDLGMHDLKGVAGPTRAWAALRVNAETSRFEALHGTGLSELVGREEECQLLLQGWVNAKAGRGQVALLSGEAGIGKSRLTEAFLSRVADEDHTHLRYFCSPQHGDSALYPVVGQMERAARLAHADDVKTRLDKFDALIAHSSPTPEDAALLAEMVALPNDGRYPALALTPQQLRQRTMEALIGQIEALTRRHPVLIIFEDAHWTDPTSLELLSRLVDRIVDRRVLLLVTFRPDFKPPWIERAHVTALTLHRLTQSEAGTLIDRVVGYKELPPSVWHDIVERADGIPLFVEEMTKAALEARSEGGVDRTIAAVSPSASAVPASLHASLMARLDRLGEAKTVAQIGAAIGREFSHALLSAVAYETDAELNSALTRLVDAGLLLRQGAPPDDTYLFNHALVQDAAYGTLLREPRRALHARIAEALETHFPDLAEARPEILARHCTEAALIEKAAALWGRAGHQSLARSALVEGEAQLTRALALIATLPRTPALRRDQIKLQISLANTLMHTKGYSAPETIASFDHANALIEEAAIAGEPSDNPLAPFAVLYGIWVANYVSFNGDVLRELAAQFLRLARKQADPVPVVIGHRIMGIALLHTGDLVDGREHLDRAIELCDPRENTSLMTLFGQDIRVTNFANRSWALWLLGYPDAARADVDQALRMARSTAHLPTRMYGILVTMAIRLLIGEYEAAKAQADELIALADEKGSLFWKSSGELHRLCLLALTDGAAVEPTSIDATLSASRSTGTTVWAPYFLAIFAKSYATMARFDAAWELIAEADIALESTEERWFEADVHRTAGEIVLLMPDRDVAKARAYFERALAVARAQSARSLELRAATSLARLHRDANEPAQARDLLTPVYDWFAEGFDTLDLQEAKALLDELRC